METKQKKKNMLKRNTLGISLKPEDNALHSAGQASLDILFGAVVGGAVGALIGRPALFGGALLSGVGYYFGNDTLPIVGLGMMATNVGNLKRNKEETIEGIEEAEVIETTAKERLVAFKDGLLSRLYVDKIQKTFEKEEDKTETTHPTKTTEATGTPENLSGFLGMASLDEIEQQLISSAMDFQSQNPIEETNEVYAPYQEDIDITSFEDFEEM